MGHVRQGGHDPNPNPNPNPDPNPNLNLPLSLPLSLSLTPTLTLTRYAKEVASGKLEWSPSHKSENFWRDNHLEFGKTMPQEP